MVKSLRSRIYLGILPLLLLFLGIMLFLIFGVRGLYRDTGEALYIGIDLSRDLGAADGSLAEMELLFSGGDDFRHWDSAALERLTNDLRVKSKSIEAALSVPGLSQLKLDLSSYGKNLNAISQHSEELSEGSAFSDELLGTLREARVRAAELKTALTAHLQRTQARIERRVTMVYSVIAAGMGIGIFLTLAISTVLWRRIIRPLEHIADGLESFGSESDSLEIDYTGKDELGQLARSLEGMTARLKEYQQLGDNKLLRSTSALRSILDQSPDAFFIFSEELQPTYMSPSANELYFNSSLPKALPDEVAERFRVTFREQALQLSREISDAVRINVAGEEKYYLVHAFPFDAPDSSDFSYESDRRQHSIAAIFQEATLLKLSDSLRRDLLATVSHELKTPITSARMSIYLLLEEQVGSLNEDQRYLLETARGDVNRQLATIKNLLDLSRVEEKTGELRRSEFIICDLIDESIKAHTELARATDVSLQYRRPAAPITIQADREKIRIVLNNFLVNAIKYSGGGKKVTVSTSSTERTNRLEVKDLGPGMNASTVRSIFSAYTRGGGRNSVEGTGLGLKIAKDIIDAHDGQIGCQSKEGAGSTFFFEIPRK